MPFTRDENVWYSITVRHDGHDREGFHASADICRRDRPETVGRTHYGHGRTLIAAEQKAYASARRECPQRRPDDWIGGNDAD